MDDCYNYPQSPQGQIDVLREMLRRQQAQGLQAMGLGTMLGSSAQAVIPQSSKISPTESSVPREFLLLLCP